MGTFRLERILRLRSQVRKLRQEEMARLQRHAEELAGLAAKLEAERQRGFAAWTGSNQGGDPKEWQLRWRYLDACADEAREARGAARAAAAEADRARTEVEASRREERRVERLKARGNERAAERAARAESRVIDELIVYRHGRRRPG